MSSMAQANAIRQLRGEVDALKQEDSLKALRDEVEALKMDNSRKADELRQLREYIETTFQRKRGPKPNG